MTDINESAPQTKRLNFLLRMKLWQKFTLLGAVGLALAAYPAYRLFKGVEDQIATAHTEQSGLVAVTATLELVQKLQDHRGSGSYFVLGDEKRGAAQPKNAADADAALAKLESVTGSLADPAITERVNTVRQQWTALKDNVTGRKIEQRAVTEDHITVIRGLLLLTEELSSAYKIDLDPDAATHHMARSTLVELPALSEALGLSLIHI